MNDVNSLVLVPTETSKPVGFNGNRFMKDAIKRGTYIHPTKKWRLEVTDELMREWVRSFNEMKANGVDVPFVAGAKDHEVNVFTTKGYVEDMWIDGDTLMFTTTVKDEDKPLVEKVRRVSIYAEKNFVDGKGNEYDNAITHICLTPTPVVPGQNDFVPIAASRSGQTPERIPVFYAMAATLKERSDEMPLPKEMIERLKKRIEAQADLTEEQLVAEIEKRLDEAEKARQEVIEKLKAMETELAAAKATLSADDAEDRAETIHERIDSLVETGVIPATKAASLKTALTGPEGARDVYMLSRTTTVDGKKPIRANVILDVIAEIGKLKLGEKTGVQNARPLSRSIPDDSNIIPDVDPETTKLMTQQAYGASVK